MAEKIHLIEQLHALSVAMMQSKIKDAQLSVILCLAVRPGCQLRYIVDDTRLSGQHACRVLDYLIGTGDVTACGSRRTGRRYWLTSRGVRIVTGMIRAYQRQITAPD